MKEGDRRGCVRAGEDRQEVAGGRKLQQESTSHHFTGNKSGVNYNPRVDTGQLRRPVMLPALHCRELG
jgi:hypothetical protein